MDDYTIVITVVLTSKDASAVAEVAKATRNYLRLWGDARSGGPPPRGGDEWTPEVEVNTMQNGRSGATVDDVIPAKIRTQVIL